MREITVIWDKLLQRIGCLMMIATRTICITILITLTYGCSQTRMLPSASDFSEAVGPPHIIQDNLWYYIGPWGPDGTLLICRVEHNLIISLEAKRYNHDDLYKLMPLLIESLQSDTGIGHKALIRLHYTMRIIWPDWDGKGTPFERGKPVSTRPRLTKDTYQEWKEWWEREGKELLSRGF